MSDNETENLRIYAGITEYCRTYNIPREYLLDILEDQKVLPMIRGKATEYIGTVFLRSTLDPGEWNVEKLNLNPQPNTIDEDISVTFRRDLKYYGGRQFQYTQSPCLESSARLFDLPRCLKDIRGEYYRFDNTQ